MKALEHRELSKTSYQKRFDNFQELILELNEREIPKSTLDKLEALALEIDLHQGTDKSFDKCLRKNRQKIIELLEKEVKLVSKGHYLGFWIAIGGGGIGVTLGVVMSQANDNTSMIAMGIPMGMGIGVVIGQLMDGKAAKEGRQLKWQVAH